MRRALCLCLVVACGPSSKTAPNDGATATPDDTAAAPAPAADATPPVAEAPASPSDTIARGDLDLVLSRGPAWLLRQIAPEPYRPKGRFEGWIITDVFPDAPELCGPRCDLRKGDVILSIEGDRVETPDAFVALLARLPDLSQLEVVRLRDGALERKRFTIAP